MKHLFLISAFLLLCNTNVFSQGCLPEGITFYDQEDIDNFQVNYPGCTVIEGDVTIYDFNSNSITNLNGLSVLTSVMGNLHITINPVLASLTGLEGLTSIGGYLEIDNNNNNTLTSLTGLNGLNSIGGGFTIYDNDALTSLTGLEGLTTIGGDLEIEWNESLISLSGLENLISIGGNLVIERNESIASLSGLEGLTSIGGALAIGAYMGGNPALTTLTGLEGLTSIGSFLVIDWNESLNSLSGLEGLTTIGGVLYIRNNGALTSLIGLGSIQANTITGLKIYNNSNLEECDVFSICQYLAAPNGEINIHDNNPGCNSPEEVQQHCLTSIEENPTDEALTIFPNPATTFININVSGGQPIEEAIIYNHLGQKALEAVPVNNTVDVSTLKPGIYFLEVITSETRTGTKLVVE